MLNNKWLELFRKVYAARPYRRGGRNVRIRSNRRTRISGQQDNSEEFPVSTYTYAGCGIFPFT